MGEAGAPSMFYLRFASKIGVDHFCYFCFLIGLHCSPAFFSVQVPPLYWLPTRKQQLHASSSDQLPGPSPLRLQLGHSKRAQGKALLRESLDRCWLAALEKERVGVLFG